MVSNGISLMPVADKPARRRDFLPLLINHQESDQFGPLCLQKQKHDAGSLHHSCLEWPEHYKRIPFFRDRECIDKY